MIGLYQIPHHHVDPMSSHFQGPCASKYKIRSFYVLATVDLTFQLADVIHHFHYTASSFSSHFTHLLECHTYIEPMYTVAMDMLFNN